MSLKDSIKSKKNYSNNYKKTSNVKVASAKQIEKNKVLSDFILQDLKKSPDTYKRRYYNKYSIKNKT